MAQGGDSDLSSTLRCGHDVLYDWACSQCEDNSKNTEASSYCQDCSRAYCPPCLALHNQFPVMQHHAVLDRARIQDWGKAGQRGSPGGGATGVRCSDHAEENVSMYCGDHDVVCCALCFSLDHRYCNDMNYIPKICTNVRQSSEYLDTEAEVDKTLSGVRKIEAEKKKGKKILDESRRNIVKKIKDLKQDVIDSFDQMANQTVKELDKVYGAVECSLQDEMKVCDGKKTELEDIKQQLHAATGKDPQVFVHMKNSQRELPKYHKAVTSLRPPDAGHYKLGIVFDPALMQLVSGVKSLGNIITKIPIATQYVVKKQSKISLRIRDDEVTCFISSMCQLPNGRILCSDYSNKRAKLLDNSSYKVIASCKMPEKPRGLACTVYPEIAVVLKNRTVQFLNVNNEKIVPVRSFPTGCNCYGIAYHSNRLYVSNMTDKLMAFDLAGSLLFTVQKDEHGSAIFSCPRNIATSSDGGKVHVADVHKGIVTVDMDGKHLATTTDPRLRGAFGVWLDRFDNVLVSGFDSCNVVQFRKGGDKAVGEITGGHGTLVNPIALCVDRYNNTLLVTSNPQDGCDSVTVLELE